jgi:hypothetical protein
VLWLVQAVSFTIYQQMADVVTQPPISMPISCPPYCAKKKGMEIRRVNNNHVTAWQTSDTYLEANCETISKCGIWGAEI